MNDKKILNSIKRSIDNAPIDILDKIKEAPREKMLAHDDITRQERGRFLFNKLIPYAPIAAAFLISFLGWQYQVKMPDSHIYLDVNPSIEIVTNRIDRVIEILADNSDAEKIIEDIDHKGKNIYQVAEEVLDKMVEEKRTMMIMTIMMTMMILMTTMITMFPKKASNPTSYQLLKQGGLHYQLPMEVLQTLTLMKMI